MNTQELLDKMRSLRDALNDMAEEAALKADRPDEYGGFEGDGLATAAALLTDLIVEAGKA